jgi:hypothetical protein
MSLPGFTVSSTLGKARGSYVSGFAFAARSTPFASATLLSAAGPVCPSGYVCCEYDAESRKCIGGCCSSASACCPDGKPGSGNTCSNLLADPANCGRCGRQCPSGQRCSGGTCTSTCPAGQRLCGDKCVNLTSDPANCGACGHVCTTQACCAGQCINISNNDNNCGGCGVVCESDRFCSGSRCICRQSGRACQAGQCQGSGCVCPTGLTYCSAVDACLDLSGDTNNCGACGNVCPSGQPCISGRCIAPPPSCSFGCAIAYGLCTVPCTADLALGKDWFICMCDCLSSAFSSPGCCVPCGVLG